MAIKRRKKFLGSSFTSNVSIDLNLEVVEQIIMYIFIDPATNPFITRKSLSNIQELFNMIDKRPFDTDEVMLARISFIQKVLNAELKENIYTYELLISKGLEGSHKEEIQNSVIPFLQNNVNLSMDEVKFINKFVSERLKYAYLYKHKEIIESTFNDLTLNRFDSIQEINSRLERELADLSTDIRRAKLDDENNSQIDFMDSSFDDNIIEIAEELKKPTSHLKTGIIKFNQMLNGGFESGRLYLFLGITGGFKSGILLNILYWIKKYNPRFKTKDPEKVPTILYITQENSLQETIERLWSIGCSNKDIRTVSNKGIVKKFKTKTFKIDEESNINICILYKANKTINTDDLYNIYDDFSDDNKEVIGVIHDYTKRIRPAQPTGELRLDLANVIDEEKLFCQTKNIPFITAAQMNRKAMEIIEEAIQSGKKNVIEKLGASNVGESWGMLENSDWVGLIQMEELINKNQPEEEPKKFLSIKQLKFRGKKPTIFNSFTQPFVEGNGMKLIDDEELGVSKSVSSLETYSETNGNNFSTKERVKSKNTVERRKAKKEKLNEIIDELSDLD